MLVFYRECWSRIHRSIGRGEGYFHGKALHASAQPGLAVVSDTGG